ncbi:hypothetical protein J1605_022300 [Eschrichtius robustus]|uniref:Uncharacterized protein n=1 Tax=Eschrichtius robustus TaxID=9764 RepID=A0AB34HDC1_ESCRO|nr:hypothetical protein J1605_022300 [Eschrichtius robustus]
MPSTGSFCLVCIYLLPCGLQQGSSSGQQESQSVQHWAPIAVSFPRGRGAEPEEAGLGSVHQKPPGWGADFSGDTGCIFQGSWVPLEDLFSHLLSESYLTATEMLDDIHFQKSKLGPILRFLSVFESHYRICFLVICSVTPFPEGGAVSRVSPPRLDAAHGALRGEGELPAVFHGPEPSSFSSPRSER